MANYYITKVLYQQNQQIIDSVEIYPVNGQIIEEPKKIKRNALVQYLQNSKSIATMTKGVDGKWKQQNIVKL